MADYNEQIDILMPAVALRGLVAFPNMNMHFDVGREKSISALEFAMESNRKIFLVAQKSMLDENPQREDLYDVGVIARIKQILKLPGERRTVRVAIEGICRAKLLEVVSDTEHLLCSVKPVAKSEINSEDEEYAQALVRTAKDIFESFVESAPQLSPDVVLTVLDAKDPSDLADFIASNIPLEYGERQPILEELNSIARLEKLCALLQRESSILKLEEEIQAAVQKQMDESQKEYYLREQMRAISSKLNKGTSIEEETEDFKAKVEALPIEDKWKQKLLKECDRLAHSQSQSPEAAVSRAYLETCLSLPWNVYTEDNLDIARAQKILDEDHYGLKKVKENITEFLAVRKLNPDIKGQIICLVGPPGVGKTSIAKSVARAMNRKYVRLSLGGVHDEAEIRGHRKTYLGSMPGRIISAIQQAGTSNPLILLDEVDKLASDYKGDPASALLEVLDGEQNFSFRDNYLELPYDLSKVMFLTTANDAGNIPAPLYDRMEVIELGSYTAEEKFHIAREHLIPKQLKAHGLTSSNLRFTDDAVRLIIDGYTREAGVRRLEQRIKTICRKAAKEIANGKKRITLKPEMLEAMLGAVKFKPEPLRQCSEIGVVNGLAWTSVGGELLEVEAASFDGTGKLELTGSLGDVMKESAKAALSYIRSRAEKLNIDKDFYKNKDIHIHCPEGAVPKDGPSAGVTMTTALVSALTDIPVRSDVAMTGEVTLRGRVLPIGGLKEKSMAAYIRGVKTVIIPKKNVSDLDEVDEAVKENIKFIAVENVDEVLNIALDNSDKKEEAHGLKMPINKENNEIWNSVTQ